jgi:hypothetical protein
MGKVEAYLDATFEYFEQNRQIFSIFFLERNTLARSLTDEMLNYLLEYENNFIGLLRDALAAGISAGVFKSLDPVCVAELFRGLIHAAILNTMRSPEVHNLADMAGNIREVFFRGVLLNENKRLSPRLDL